MPRRIVSLNRTAWQLGQAPPGALPGHPTWQDLDRVAEWLPATVPGNIRADLMRAGRLPDLAWGTNAKAGRWVDDVCWWLTSAFSLARDLDERVHLVLRGVDYIADLFLNGQPLGRHEGMFSPQVHDVTALLSDENRLAVHLTGNRWLPHDRSTSWEKLLNRAEVRVSSLSKRFPHRRDTLKCQMGFGWDFSPALPTIGIWDDVCLVVSGPVLIQNVAVRQQAMGDEVAVTAGLALDAQTARRVKLRCTLAGETFEREPLVVDQAAELDPGLASHSVEMVISEPRRWWPWDHGQPDLYRLTVEVWDGDHLLDSIDQVVGLCQVEMKDWNLYVNGQRIYARGANWVPADIFPGRVRDEDYRALLTLARQANMNMLRVWGGGLREKRAFYDLCDRLGILVWQEFPIACAFLTRYPRSAHYLRLVEAEARAIVRDLRNHTCLAVWCGGNEFSPRRNAPLVATLQRAVTTEDPARPFLPASPGSGDSHNWRVWHDFQPPSTYLDDPASFASEFGLQAPPDVATLRRFIPAGDLWPPGPSWACHGAGLEKLRHYARPFLLEEEPGLDAFVAASQQAQAYGLQLAVEHYRRRKAAGNGGVLVWQLNEPWPAISWALLDFYRQPKPAYETVKRLFNPVLVSVEYRLRHFRAGERFQARVWIVNDRAEALPGCHLEMTLWSMGKQPQQVGESTIPNSGVPNLFGVLEGQAAHHFTCTMDVPADSAQVVGNLDWVLPEGGGWRLTCRLAQGDEILSANGYDLTVHDDFRPPLKYRLWIWLRDHLLPG